MPDPASAKQVDVANFIADLNGDDDVCRAHYNALRHSTLKLEGLE